jgi:hypothetical protein
VAAYPGSEWVVHARAQTLPMQAFAAGPSRWPRKRDEPVLKLEDLTQTVIEQAIKDFHKSMSGHVSSIVMHMAHDRYSIAREPRRMGNAQFSYYFAADLDLLFRYALGGAEASGTLIEGIASTVLDLLELSPSGARASLNWDTFIDTPLGVAVKAALARVRLRRQSEPLAADEVCLLSGWNPQKLAAAKIQKDDTKKALYAPEAVKDAFEREGLRI